MFNLARSLLDWSHLIGTCFACFSAFDICLLSFVDVVAFCPDYLERCVSSVPIFYLMILFHQTSKVPSLERGCAPALVNLNCNSPDFCVENAPVLWLRPWSCRESYHLRRTTKTCPDPFFANLGCGRSPERCTSVFYEWAMENSYDFEENVVQPWVSPSRFAPYYRAARRHYPWGQTPLYATVHPCSTCTPQSFCSWISGFMML